MNKEPIKFRQAAIDHVASLSRLDHMIRITSPYLWVMMLAIYVLIIALVIWAFVGVVPTRVQGQGILIAQSGNIYDAVAPEGEGRLIRFAVMVGDTVKKDQVIAYIDHPYLKEQIKLNKIYLNQLVNKYNQQLQFARSQILNYQNSLQAQNNVLKNIIAAEDKSLASIADFLKTQRNSYLRGLDTKERLMNTVQLYHNSQQSIDNSRLRLAQNKVDEANYTDQWRQRLQDLEFKVRDQRYKVKELESQLTSTNEVRSPVDGVVTALEASVGSNVRAGDALANIVSLGSGEDAVVYVSPQEGKRVEEGMQALVSPANIKKEEYGSIRAKVISVSKFPVSKETMRAILQNENLVELFAHSGPPIGIRVSLKMKKDTYSGYDWTSSKGPEEKITSGTLVTVDITVKEQHPISLIIPTFKKWLGIS